VKAPILKPVGQIAEYRPRSFVVTKAWRRQYVRSASLGLTVKDATVPARHFRTWAGSVLWVRSKSRAADVVFDCDPQSPTSFVGKGEINNRIRAVRWSSTGCASSRSGGRSTSRRARIGAGSTASLWQGVSSQHLLRPSLPGLSQSLASEAGAEPSVRDPALTP
jgi:hypothetical protein